jgi:hypothetical protein
MKPDDVQQPDEQQPDEQQPDERPFPSAAAWLSVPSDAPVPSPDFVARTLAAIAADADLERALAEADEALPRELLQSFAAPLPGRRFTERTLRAIDRERRQRWQQMLARHVAPDPSPLFVSRTLDALAADRVANGPAATVRGRTPASSAPASSASASSAPASNAPASNARLAKPKLAKPRLARWFAAAAVAAALLIAPQLVDPRPEESQWQETRRAATPVAWEQRLRQHLDPATAVHAGPPLAAVLARTVAMEQTGALAAQTLGDDAPDGFWLADLGVQAEER